MFYKDSVNSNRLHSIDEILDNKIDARQALNMIVISQYSYKEGAPEEVVLDNLDTIRVSIFKDVNSGEVLVNPDLIELVVDYTYNGDNGEIVYDTFRRIVSLKEFNAALMEKGYVLSARTIDDIIGNIEEDEVDLKVVKCDKIKKLVRM